MNVPGQADGVSDGDDGGGGDDDGGDDDDGDGDVDVDGCMIQPPATPRDNMSDMLVECPEKNEKDGQLVITGPVPSFLNITLHRRILLAVPRLFWKRSLYTEHRSLSIPNTLLSISISIPSIARLEFAATPGVHPPGAKPSHSPRCATVSP